MTKRSQAYFISVFKKFSSVFTALAMIASTFAPLAALPATAFADADTAGPTISNVSPTDGATISGTQTIAEDATDPSGISLAEVKMFSGTDDFSAGNNIYSDQLNDPTTGNTFSFTTLNTTLHADGPYTIEFIAHDNAVPQNTSTTTIHVTINNHPVASNPVEDTTQGTYFSTIQAAIDAANPGDTIALLADLTVPSEVDVNKHVTIDGQGHTVSVSGTGYRFLITGDGTTLKDMDLTKTDKTGEQNIVGIQADNVTIDSVNFTGQYSAGDGDVSRALEISGNDFTITNSSFKNLRQPAYINSYTGSVTNSYTDGTKGWVVVQDSDVAFTGNTWGTNATDIAIIQQGTGANHYTCAVTAQIRTDNNDASVDNQVDTSCTPTLNAENFNTVNDATYKGVSVGFDAKDFGTVSAVTVDMTRADGSHAIKHGTQVLFNLISANAAPYQYTAPFVIQAGTYDPTTDTYWTSDPATWSTNTTPQSVTITVTGTNGTESVTNPNFSQGAPSWPAYADLVPAAAPMNLQITQNGNTYVCDGSTILNSNGSSPHTTGLTWNLPPGETSTGYKVVPTYPSGSHGTPYTSSGTATSVWIAGNIGQGYGKAPNDQGTYSYSVTYKDANGQWSLPATCSLVYDTVEPTVSVAPSASTLSGTVTFNITINDANAATSSNKAIYVYLYNTTDNSQKFGQKVDLSSGTGTFTVDTTKLADGSYNLDVAIVHDAAGNASGVKDNYFSGYTINNSAPAAPTNLKFNYTKDGDGDNAETLACGATVNSNKPTTFHKGGSLNLNWTAPAGTITGYQDLITYPDGSSHIAYQGPNNWSWITFDHGNGVYTYQVRANSANGLSAYSSACSIAYDTHSPTAQFDPAPAEYVNGNFTVSGEASDNVALKSVLFDVRDPHDTTGNAWRAGCVSGSQSTTMSADSKNATSSCTISTKNLTEGYPYIVRIHAGDFAGYGSSGQQQTLILDTTRPSATITAPGDGTTQTGSFTITGTATDALSGIDHVNIYVSKVVAPDANGKTFGGYVVDNQPATWDAGAGTFSYDVSGLVDGTYVVKAVAYDKAGNDHFASPSPTITVQNPAPVYITTDAATNVTFSDATLNGTNDDSDAAGHSFWVSTSTFATSSSNIPANVYSTPDFGSIAAHTDFTSALSSLTTDAVITGGVHSAMPAITPNTTYYYVAWSRVGGTWYPGAEQSFTTTTAPSVTTDAATNVTQADATLNGTNGAVDAQGYLFWVSKSAIDTSNPNVLPTGAVRTAVLGSAAAGQSFSASLSSLTTAGVPSDMAAITPDTTYHYVAWVKVNGTWYPGADETVTTAAAPVKTAVTLQIHQTDIATSTTDIAANPTKWYFADDQNDIVDDSLGAFVNGPGTAPIGNGSAQLSIASASEGRVLATQSFKGIPLSDISKLSYSTYRSAGDAALAPALQFDVNSTGTTTPAHYEGRLIFEPYQTGATVETGQWQSWDAMTGAGWWFSHASATAANGKVVTTCTQANPCTWSQVLAQFPDIGITGMTGFKIGSGWTSGFTGNVDDFVIEINDSANDITTTYDFEPRTGTITTITNAADLVANGSTVGVPFHVAWSVAPVTGIGTPTGTVDVTVNGGAGCSATVADGGCDITPTSVGSVTLQAKYNDDASFDQSSSATVSHQVNAASNPSNNGTVSGGGGGGPVAVIGDLNGDGRVNFLDFALLMTAMTSKGTNLAADLNGDGRVDLADLAVLMAHWTF